MNLNRINLKHELQQDNIFPTVIVKSLHELTGIPCRKGLTKAIISENEIVNVVSNSYGHLPNEKYFAEVETQLIEAGVEYDTRSINRGNRSFAADYILNDDNFIINVKNGIDKMRPMIRFTNSYDGSNKTAGYFGFFREVCSNGLHIAETNFGFSVKHKGDMATLVMPEIRKIIAQFMDNEYYTLQRKFEVLAETPITDLKQFVKCTAESFNLFQYAISEKNPAPSLNARIVEETIVREAKNLGTSPNFWHGYNAFNEILHNKLKKPFENQRNLDSQIFTALVESATN